jgi:hypothetical protein
MNKALHRLYLFALNKLSETQQGTNRGLFLIASGFNNTLKMTSPYFT